MFTSWGIYHTRGLDGQRRSGGLAELALLALEEAFDVSAVLSDYEGAADSGVPDEAHGRRSGEAQDGEEGAADEGGHN